MHGVVGSLISTLLHIYQRIFQWKNSENQLKSDSFLAHPVYMPGKMPSFMAYLTTAIRQQCALVPATCSSIAKKLSHGQNFLHPWNKILERKYSLESTDPRESEIRAPPQPLPYLMPIPPNK